jgi:hypothetical protein
VEAVCGGLTFSPEHVLALFVFNAPPPADSAPTQAPPDPALDQADARARGAGETAEARAERHLRTLKELAEIGMELARAVRRQAVEAPAGGDAPGGEPGAGDVGLVFSRIARAVRLTLALEARLEQDRQARDAQIEAALAPRRELQATLKAGEFIHRSVRRSNVKKAVEQAIDAEADRAGAAERDVENWLADLDERLADAADDADFMGRPVGELIARICRDLGLTPDWSLWEDEDWAIAEARARPRGSPYAVRRPNASRRNVPANAVTAAAGSSP